MRSEVDELKAQFDNSDERLWPGAFVNVRLAVQTLKGAVVVPQASVIQSQRGRMVYVVEANGKAAARRSVSACAAGGGTMPPPSGACASW